MAHRPGVTLHASSEGYEDVLTEEALAFVADLHRRFDGRRRELLAKREERQKGFDAGDLPDFLPETRRVREGDWRVAPAPDDLNDRRTEITGPADRKMMINALNSGANVFMADLEDSLSPTWDNVAGGQVNLRDAVRRQIELVDEARGKTYELGGETATLVVRPRGWHLPEKHISVDGERVSASLFDFGLYFFHNAAELLERGSGPYFYLPKLESHLEARLWNDVFVHAQEFLGVPTGSVRATVLIETILAAYEMDEILYELRDHAAGLNAGRWDYIFSAIKKFRTRKDMILPDRKRITMTVPFMKSYAELLVQVCHRRGAHAIGGMSAYIPTRRDPEANEKAMTSVAADKRREAGQGYDGTWVAHPDLVPVARDAFDDVMGAEPNQKHVARDDLRVSAEDLLPTDVEGAITDEGVRMNVDVALQYLNAWLQGNGAAAIYNLMEDAATAEISRAQLWQWIHQRAELQDGRLVTDELYANLRSEELRGHGASSERYRQAAELLDELVFAADFVPFLTLPAYDLLP